eukprot:NODE_25526_length_584_cov_2.229759.p1 GENE.NODE_25526_length_584_cov_2.229759~~NODE_25526_length_584_cov_2.229759.p1  ORF type:complete len:114 (+),score=24.51 NODE_25526_length_584_cov_2.229759:46-387(+)
MWCVRRKGGARWCFFANITHISPWAVSCGMLGGAGRVLRAGGVLIIYGPFKVNGSCTTQSNADFDMSLRAQNKEWGYRDVQAIVDEAAKNGLEFQERYEMPANNFMLRFLKVT